MVFISMIDFFNYSEITRSIATEFQTWAIIISTLALGIGVINMLFIHGNNIVKIKGDRLIPSGVLIFSMLIMIISGLADLELKNPIFVFSYTYIYQVLHGAVYGLTGFYITSSIFKSYRARSNEAIILIITGVILLLKNAPVGELILGKGIITLGDWLMAVPNTAGNYAILIGFGIGTVLLSLRIILGLEKGVAGGASE